MQICIGILAEADKDCYFDNCAATYGYQVDRLHKLWSYRCRLLAETTWVSTLIQSTS
jgi:hypothetical protein